MDSIHDHATTWNTLPFDLRCNFHLVHVQKGFENKYFSPDDLANTVT